MPLKPNWKHFYDSIINDTDPLVTIEDGYNSLDVAYKIMEKINHTQPG
jgi:predicted dehydrogenase